MTPLVTVLVPMYNRQQYIEDCVRSVQAQSWGEWELLLVDDGSTDDTVKLCRTMAQADSRIRLVFSDHGGVSRARNQGLELARGKYVFFLDSDDVIHPLLLETLVLAMERQGTPIAGSLRHHVPERGWHKVPEVMARQTQLGHTDLKDHEAMLEAVFTTQTPLNVIGGVMIRRDWIGQTRFREDLYIGEDFYFVYENMIKGAEALFLREVWYYARLHESNLSWDFAYSGFANRLYRRELVWQQEEAFGRPQYANVQKRQVYGIWLKCLSKKTVNRSDKAQMRKTMRAYRKTLFPGLTLLMKLSYIGFAYLPVMTPILLLFWKFYKKIRKNP